MRIYVANDYDTLIKAVRKADHEAVALNPVRSPSAATLGERLELIESAGAVLFTWPADANGGFDVGYAIARGKPVILHVPMGIERDDQNVLSEAGYLVGRGDLHAVLMVYHRDKSACQDKWHEADEGKNFFSNRGPCPTCKESHR